MRATLAQLLDLAGMPRKRLALSIVLGALTVLLGVGLITTSGYLVSRAAEHPPVLSLTVAIVAVRFFGLSRPLARYLDRIVSHDLALRALGRIRSRFYAGIEPLAPAQLEGFRRGDLVSRMVGDVDALQGLYLRGIGPPSATLVVAVVAVATSTLILPFAGLVLATGLAVAGLCVPLLAARLAVATGRSQRQERGELTADLVELLRGAPELVLYGAAPERLAAVRDADRRLARLGRRDALVAGSAAGLIVLVAGLTTAGVLAVAVAAHAGGSLDRTLVATVALLALASYEAVTPLPAAAQELRATVAAGRRVLELIERPSAITDPAAPAEPPGPSPAVALESVTVRYAPDAETVLERFDLLLEPGGRVALVGESGAGKTTVVNLLFRFLDPERGTVTIGGRDIRTLRQEDVRRTFALAGQEAHVFNSTIRENLLLARPEASEEDLLGALRRARLGAWVTSLPLGLDTLVGEEGSRLSGGQRQRLVLARAFLVDAPVLVLDEPTVHLDPETAEELMQDVFAAAPGQTILLITHRREGLDLVDRIVELEDGRDRALAASGAVNRGLR